LLQIIRLQRVAVTARLDSVVGGGGRGFNVRARLANLIGLTTECAVPR
jgi:hypothetical protein